MKGIWLVVLCGCTVMNTVEGYVDNGRSNVYICDGHNELGQTNEWCFPGTAEEVEDLTGVSNCHATGIFERTSVIGCWWHCDDISTPVNEGAGNGCNSHNGCLCL